MPTWPDYQQHNEEAQAVWAAYRVGHPTRVPVTLWTDARFFLQDPSSNPGRTISFQDYSDDLAPATPIPNLDAMYQAARLWGKYA